MPVREVSTEEGLEFAKMMNAPFFEISSKLSVNVHEMFLKIVWETLYITALNEIENAQKRKKKKCIIS